MSLSFGLSSFSDVVEIDIIKSYLKCNKAHSHRLKLRMTEIIIIMEEMGGKTNSNGLCVRSEA